MQNDPPQEGVAPAVARIVTRNIEALVERARAEERRAPLGQRVADAITRFTGSLTFVGLHLFLFGAWIVVNLGWTPFPEFDPSFVILAMVASVEAIFLSTFVLISQNRIQQLADQRADLDLQISLLAEYEITRLVELVGEIARKMGVEAGSDPELGELAQNVAPEKVMDAIVDPRHRPASGS
jgi:uncharacterized membrane protein